MQSEQGCLLPETNGYPRLRPVEVFPAEQDGQRVLVMYDPSGLAAGSIAVSGAALFLMSMFDGQHSLAEIEEAFFHQFAQHIERAQIESLIERLDEARFLESDRFHAYYQSLVDAYRAAPARICHTQGAAVDGESLNETIGRMLRQCSVAVAGRSERRLRGLVAPHLDYPRGTPCYADAYGLLATVPPAERYVILGTNHFGRASSVVATSKDFESPLGRTRTDRAFLAELDRRLNADLCRHEFDHQQEHSVELQVLILQHLLGADRFEIVPFLCPDPCGPTGTRPYDGEGVDLHDFATVLGEMIRADGRSTVVIAGADLSHVGRRFGDDRELDAEFLSEVERLDRQSLACVTSSGNGAFVEDVRARGNRTRICSVGCIYALMTALEGTQPELLRYHQAVDVEDGTCVTCSAMVFWE